MASLKDQLDKATKALNLAESNVKVREADTKDTRYGKFDPNSTYGKQALARLKSAGAAYNKAKKYYDGILASYNQELQDKKTTGEQEGVSEEVQAAKLDLTVEQLRKQKQDALDKEKAARDIANKGALDQQSVATYSELLNTLVADEAQLKSVQEDLRKNFPSLYKGQVSGLKDWIRTQAALEAIAERRGQLPKGLQGASLREFLLSPTIDITIDSKGAGGPELDIVISSPTQAASTIQGVFKNTLNRDATPEEVARLTTVLNKAERSAGRKTKTSGGRTEYTTDIDRVQFLTEEVKKIKDLKTGKSEFETKRSEKDTLNTQSLQLIAKANGITLSPQEIEQYNLDIRNGKDINVIKNQIRNLAGIGRPDNIKKLLAEGTDLGTIYAPYKRTMATLLELDPESIDINDTTLQTAIGDKELPIYEFRKLLKKDPRWQYTNNAREEVSSKALRVLRDFGFQG
jgi:hypothetical protein